MTACEGSLIHEDTGVSSSLPSDMSSGTEGEGESERDLGSAPDMQREPEFCPPDDEPAEHNDVLTPLRLYRKASLTLRGTPPSLEELEALEALEDVDAQLASIDAFIDAQLDDKVFYRTMFTLARDWLQIPLVPGTADAPEYGVLQQRALAKCPEASSHPGAWHYARVHSAFSESPV